VAPSLYLVGGIEWLYFLFGWRDENQQAPPSFPSPPLPLLTQLPAATAACLVCYRIDLLPPKLICCHPASRRHCCMLGINLLLLTSICCCPNRSAPFDSRCPNRPAGSQIDLSPSDSSRRHLILHAACLESQLDSLPLTAFTSATCASRILGSSPPSHPHFHGGRQV